MTCGARLKPAPIDVPLQRSGTAPRTGPETSGPVWSINCLDVVPRQQRGKADRDLLVKQDAH
jgi:hypothetical protein